MENKLVYLWMTVVESSFRWFSLSGAISPICRVGLGSQPLIGFCVFHKFCHAPNTSLAVSFGFSRVVLTGEAERPLFPVYVFSHWSEFLSVVFFSYVKCPYTFSVFAGSVELLPPNMHLQFPCNRQPRLLWAFSGPSHRIRCSVISLGLIIKSPGCPIGDFRGVSWCSPSLFSLSARLLILAGKGPVTS